MQLEPIRSYGVLLPCAAFEQFVRTSFQTLFSSCDCAGLAGAQQYFLRSAIQLNEESIIFETVPVNTC